MVQYLCTCSVVSSLQIGCTPTAGISITAQSERIGKVNRVELKYARMLLVWRTPVIYFVVVSNFNGLQRNIVNMHRIVIKRKREIIGLESWWQWCTRSEENNNRLWNKNAKWWIKNIMKIIWICIRLKQSML